MTTREIPAEIAETASTARALLRDAEAMTNEAGPMMRAVAKHLTEQGWTQVEIGAVLGVSKQRVSQLVNPPKKATPKA